MAGHKVIVGIGKTGLSCARYFAREGVPFAVVDSNPSPQNLAALREIVPGIDVGDLTADAMLVAEEIVLSPGVPLAHDAIQAAMAAGVPVTGDIAMFGRLAEAPLVAITGSNGKSTVTAMVGELARACGQQPGVGGNIGTPCLDLLADAFDVYAIEVSSYQLEVATDLPSAVAVVLNLAPDHLDRYQTVDDYYRAKASIYRQASTAVVNRDCGYPFEFAADAKLIYFGSAEPAIDTDFGLRDVDGETWLCRGPDNLLCTSELPIRGRHNHLNAVASLAIGSALDWDLAGMIEGLRSFPGLPHRCEVVGEYDGVLYINDSKSTNVESALAAIEGIAPDVGPLTLVLGGIGKGADFSRLNDALVRHVERVLIYGRDREAIRRQMHGFDRIQAFETLEEVVGLVRSTATKGDCVLLSPGCASLDQFANFEERGERFRSMVSGGAS